MVAHQGVSRNDKRLKVQRDTAIRDLSTMGQVLGLFKQEIMAQRIYRAPWVYPVFG